MTNIRLSSEKKTLVAWHDITAVYVVVLLVMSAVFLFALAGLEVALSIPRYQGHVWVPAALLAMSGFLFIAAAARLLRRLWLQLKEKYTRDADLPY